MKFEKAGNTPGNWGYTTLTPSSSVNLANFASFDCLSTLLIENHDQKSYTAMIPQMTKNIF